MIQQDADITIHINDKEAEETVTRLQNRAKELRKAMADAYAAGDKKTFNKLNSELKKTNKELNNAQLNSARIRAAMKHLSEATPKELHQTIKLINKELNSGNVKRGSAQWKEYQEQLRRVKEELNKIQAESRETQSAMSRMNTKIKEWGASVAGALASITRLSMAAQGAVQDYADMDSAMANAQKFTGMTRAEVEQLNEELKKMDTRTSREELNELAASAGRLGKSSVEDVMGFVRAGDVIGVAMDELGTEAPEIISKLAGIFNLEAEMGTEKAMLAAGSAINSLSASCASSAPGLVDFASRMGAVANQTNMTMDEMLAFGALLESNAVSIEKGSTAMQTVISKMYADPAKFAKTAGMSIDEFTAALNRSSTEGLTMFIDRLAQMDQMQIASTLKTLGIAGTGVTTTFQTLAGKAEELRTRMQESKTAFEEATSVTEEFNVQNNTVQARLDKAKKRFHELSVELGEKLLPIMNYAISAALSFVKGIKVVIDFVIEYKSVIVPLVAAIGTYIVVTKAASALSVIYNTALEALAATKVALTNGAKLLKIAMLALTGQFGKARVAAHAFSATVSATPWGMIAGAIAAIGAAIYSIASSAEDASEPLLTLEEQLSDVENAHLEAEKAVAPLVTKFEVLKKQWDLLADSFDEKKKFINANKTAFNELFGSMIEVEEAERRFNEGTEAFKKSLLDRALATALQSQITKLYEKKAEEIAEINARQYSEEGDYTRASEFAAEVDAYERATGKNAVYSIPPEGSFVDKYGVSYIKLTGEMVKIANIGARQRAIEQTSARLNEKIQVLYKELEPLLQGLTGDQPPVKPETDLACPKCGNFPCTCKKSDPEKDPQKKAQAEYERETAINDTAYYTGAISYEQYLQKKQVLLNNYITLQKKILEDAGLTETKEYADLIRQEWEISQKAVTEARDQSIADAEAAKQAAIDAAMDAFLDPANRLYQNQEALNEALLDADLAYLNAKKTAAAGNAEEIAKIEAEIAKRSREDQLARQREFAERYKAFMDEYFAKSQEDRHQDELDFAKKLYDLKLINEEQYLAAVDAINKKYADGEKEDRKKITSEYTDMVNNLYQSWKTFFDGLGKEGSNFWENLSNAATATYAMMSAGLQQYSAYSNAERDLELAKVEKRYDAEIEAAGNNTKKKEKLEKQKEAEIAKIKKKYNDRAMKIEIAQAIAQTAAAAIAAYASAAAIPATGWIMAPIAAALATAAGLVQIATIKKQHQAQAAGYYSGGFTDRDPNNRKEVGVVHANEFVANHQAVANPNIRPFLNLLDHAQRNNTVGSLTADDVSLALGNGRYRNTTAAGANEAASTQTNIHLDNVAMALSASSDAIAKLNERIDAGIETYMVMDGERGFDKKYSTYKKLQTKPKR